MVKRGISALMVGGAVVAGLVVGPAATASADTGRGAVAAVADDGCPSLPLCADAGPLGNAINAVRRLATTLGYGTGSSSGTANYL
ncbi:hypothetical protein [Nocardia sp. A7]|uniref:hypothetical protein n=1 Tax=Nocardia sp. A7 TaxID=2789274 RepID=UPI00397C0748